MLWLTSFFNSDVVSAKLLFHLINVDVTHAGILIWFTKVGIFNCHDTQEEANLIVTGPCKGCYSLVVSTMSVRALICHLQVIAIFYIYKYVQ